MSAEAPQTDFSRNLDLPPFPSIEQNYLPENVDVHFHLAPHKTAEHFEAASELLKTSDVYIPELAGWDQKARKEYTAISKGDRKAIAKAKADTSGLHLGYRSALVEALAGTYKPVLFIDASETQRAFITGDFERVYKRAVGFNVEDTLNGFADAMSGIAYRVSMRDRIMAANLGPAVTALVAGHPRLNQNDTVKVLCTVGHGHEALYNYLSKQEHAERKVSASHWSYHNPKDPENTIYNSYKSGIAPERNGLISMMVANALARSALRGFSASRAFYDFAALWSRKPDRHYVLGAKTLDVFMRDPEQAAEWAQTVLRARPGAVSKGNTYELLKANVIVANELLVDEYETRQAS
ncbi:MAG: hypothetical protein JWO35_367 [Candidatus Saccharibacteria bacterium]|nr:hypothetical protein [Candidatus Saccharibacteria bacterium]